MKNFTKLLVLLLALSMLAGCFVACDSGEKPPVDETTVEESTTAGEGETKGEEELAFVDYASTVKFDPASGRAYANVTVRTFVDGDTTHEGADGDVPSWTAIPPTSTSSTPPLTAAS